MTAVDSAGSPKQAALRPAAFDAPAASCLRHALVNRVTRPISWPRGVAPIPPLFLRLRRGSPLIVPGIQQLFSVKGNICSLYWCACLVYRNTGLRRTTHFLVSCPLRPKKWQTTSAVTWKTKKNWRREVKRFGEFKISQSQYSTCAFILFTLN